ncbi:hypothetical protein CTAM01_09730 [Colletotrichum tamarilloi]|uniref:Uncharacterized protein n=1 Tax=Colletotrichum tamarilloi TaxID=1209934 RepID=A0ABQ9R2L8_9PEZI|nr:hypothetical protein CTAM01_09730 [Colletotrichum tamarilloi]
MMYVWCVVAAGNLRGKYCSWSCILGRNR